MITLHIYRHRDDLLDPSPELSLSAAWSGFFDGASVVVGAVVSLVLLASLVLPFETISLRSCLGEEFCEDFGETFTWHLLTAAIHCCRSSRLAAFNR